MASIRSRKRTGLLFLDFRWQGRRYREQTTLIDTPANRARLQRVLARIEKQIELNTFDYAAFFHHGPGVQRPTEDADALKPETARSVGTPKGAVPATPRTGHPMFEDFARQWLREHKVEWRRSHLRTLESTIDGHLVPRSGTRVVSDISKADILAFRAELSTQPGRGLRPSLSNKRINGIIGPLKQILNEAAERYEFPPPTGRYAGGEEMLRQR